MVDFSNPLLGEVSGYLLLAFFFWGIFALFHFFHQGLSIFWKLSLLVIALLFFLFYAGLFLHTVNSLYPLSGDTLKLIIKQSLFFLQLLEVFLYFYWPFLLVRSFFSAKESYFTNRVKVMIVITLLLWVIKFILIWQPLQNLWKQSPESLSEKFHEF